MNERAIIPGNGPHYYPSAIIPCGRNQIGNMVITCDKHWHEDYAGAMACIREFVDALLPDILKFTGGFRKDIQYSCTKIGSVSGENSE